VSARTPAAASPTRTLPARWPDGFPLQNRRYFWYFLFAGTGMVLTLAAIVVLCVLRALASGFGAWAGLLETLASPPVLLLNGLLWIGVLYFAVRFLWVGVKIPSVKLGPIPAPPASVILVGHFAGLITLSLVLIVLFSGVVR
jgi:fumarate reductase subunit C